MAATLSQVDYDAVIAHKVEFLLGEFEFWWLEESGVDFVESLLWRLINRAKVSLSSRS